LTLTSATGIAGLAALFGVAAKSAYDYAKALNPDNKLTEQEKKDATAIRAKNKEILASIELLKKQRGMATGPITGLNTAQGISTQSIDAQIAAQQKLLVQNNALIKGIEKKSIADAQATTIADAAAQKEQQRVSAALGGKAKAFKLEKDNLLEMQLLKLKNAALDEEIAKKELKMAKFQAFGDTSNVKDLPTFAGDLVKHFEKFPAIGEKIMGITTNLGTLKSPLSVMDTAVQASTQLQSDNLDQLALKYQAMLDMTNMVGDAAANAFTALGNSIVDSMGLAKTGLEGFAGQMMQTLVQLGAMVVKQLAMNLAASLGWATQSATQSGAATGPLAVFTTPAFISTAIGGVMAAFASIPKFAAGGIVSGPTMGLMGEYPGAKSNPEVIAPLSKLQGMLDQGNGGGGAMSGEFVLRGQDLVVALARAEKQRNRIG
jgi:phosphoribosylformylglycinamidine (FGAM) synthase PurS component